MKQAFESAQDMDHPGVPPFDSVESSMIFGIDHLPSGPVEIPRSHLDAAREGINGFENPIDFGGRAESGAEKGEVTASSESLENPKGREEKDSARPFPMKHVLKEEPQSGSEQKKHFFEMTEAEQRTLAELRSIKEAKVTGALSKGIEHGERVLSASKDFIAYANQLRGAESDEEKRAVLEELMKCKLYHLLVGSTEEPGSLECFDLSYHEVENYIRNGFLA